VDVGAGTRALVTGSSRGIGRAFAQALARRGATVGLAARSEEELAALAAELPGEHVVLPCDVGDRASVAAAVERFIAEAGGLDLVIANAGIANYGPFRDMDLDTVERMTRVNWLGTVFTVKAALGHLLEQRRGHIVIVSSGAGLRSFPDAAVYGATKSAQRGFGEALRHELAGTGVGLTVVYPGEIVSALHDHEKDTMPSWYRGGPKAAPADELAKRVIAAIESDARGVHYPPLVRLLGIVHGLSPRLADAMLRRMRGNAAAPKR
jgi:short-subunit dehydrogenase